jgi:L-rhamnose isomerase
VQNKEVQNKEVQNKEVRNKEVRNKEVQNKEVRNKEVQKRRQLGSDLDEVSEEEADNIFYLEAVETKIISEGFSSLVAEVKVPVINNLSNFATL